MYGDTDQLRRRVDQLREQGLDVRTLADQLVSRTEGLGWTGRAAESMRVRIHERAARLRDAASDHEVAASSLDRHLTEVRHLQEAIAHREHKAASLVADARSRIAQVEAANDAAASVVRRVADADDQVLVGFVPPPPGHRDWLSVELPGL